MNWMNKLERKLGKYAIPNLMLYIIILYGVGFVFSLIAPSFYYYYLSLDIKAVLHGQIWRLVTFIIQPPATNLIFVFFTLYLYYMIGRQLEYVWGTFRFNLYFFMGVIFHIVAAILVYLIFKVSLPIGTYYLNMSLFFAYAAIYPNQQFYLFMVIPVKVKWLALLDGVLLLLEFLIPIWQIRIALLMSLINLILFFGKSVLDKMKNFFRRRKYMREVRQAERERYENNEYNYNNDDSDPFDL
jgi:hypothetical protein